ncbi:transcriptional regulator [Salmonella enterica subsp. enterica]|nr:transcriptional regulator [Salmonella enterica subsp. enterica]
MVNEHGRLLYPRALALLEQAVEIEQLFREDNGAIRVYASSTIGNYILPAMIARYRQHYPALPLELSVGNSQDVINAVLDFRVDIGLIEGRVTVQRLSLSRGWKMSWWSLPRRPRR